MMLQGYCGELSATLTGFTHIIFPTLIIVFPDDILQDLPVTSNHCKFEIPAP